MKYLRYYTLSILIMALIIMGAGSYTVNAQESSWELTITGQDQNGNTLNLVMGTNESATDGFDPEFDQYAPPAAPNGSFDMRIVDGAEDYFKQFRPLTTEISTWTMIARPSEDGTPQVTLTWNTNELESANGIFLLDYGTGSEAEQINLKTVGELELPEGEQEFTISHLVQEPVSDSYSEGWQLIGYPSEGTNVDPFNIFSNGIDGTFFSHIGNYSEESVFTPGVGYWIRLSEQETVTIDPPLLNSVTLNMEPGWTLISGPGLPVAFSDIDDPDNLLVPGSLQGYDGGYSEANTLRPGRGYWVQSQGSGSVTISSDYNSISKQTVQKTMNEPEGFVSFKMSTHENESPKFYLGGSLDEQTEVNPLSFSMPPLPPNGAFDVRFDNDSRLMNGPTGTLIVRSPGDSLTISHTNQSDDHLLFSYVREDSDQLEELEINPEESITISAEGISQIDVQLGVVNSVGPGSEQPQRLELAQNYPNPFNPSTEISYNLPQAGAVTLEVFDMTGRRISVLTNRVQSAGTYTLTFDASDLSSGVYMYRLQSGGSVLTRKMTLIK